MSASSAPPSTFFRHEVSAEDVQNRAFYGATPIKPSTFRIRLRGQDEQPLSDLSPLGAVEFCHKDVATYDLALSLPERQDLFKLLWKAWYPQRDARKTDNTPPDAKANPDVALDAWWCKAMIVKGEDDSEGRQLLQTLIAWHEALCERLKAMEGQRHRRREVVAVNESFARLFVVWDRTEWQQPDGCLVVCREDAAAAHGLDVERSIDMLNSSSTSDRKWGCWRMDVQTAVEVSLHSYTERARGKAPLSEAFQAYLRTGHY